MTTRDRILDAAEKLIAAGDSDPSLDAVAAAAGVSKGGLLYHFASKPALVHGLILRAVATADEVLTAAASQGRMASAWLELSVPTREEQQVYRALLPMLRLSTAGGVDLPDELPAAYARWRGMLEDELGDREAALIVQLVGDGLLLNALMGSQVEPDRVDALIERLASS